MDAGRAADGKNAVPTGMWLAISLILGALILRPVVVASPPDDPAAMEIRLDAHFGDAYALLGYTLHSQTIRDTLDITLFWRAHADTHLDYRPVVEVVNLRQTEVWGADRPLFIGPNPVTHTPDHFVSHRHRLDVEAPPYAAQVRVTLFDGDTPVGDPVLLPERIPIVAATPDADDPDYVFENAIGANVSCTDDEIEIVWQVLEPLAIPGVTVLVHGLDAAGEIVNQADGPPLDGDYPLDLWRRGQTLADHFSLPGAQRVAVGLYTADRRLTITEGGQALTDHVIVVMCEG